MSIHRIGTAMWCCKTESADVVELIQAQMLTVDMVPDNPGIWMYHCHFDDHMNTGMATLYKVEP